MPFVRAGLKRSVMAGALAVSLAALGACASRGDEAERPEAAIAVNGFLWRATLDTLNFMPLETADPYGGLVITDWYAAPEAPNERFKATVYLLDSRLRADGLNVVVFKQVKDAAGGWVDAEPSAQTAVDLENAILTRARELRLRTVG